MIKTERYEGEDAIVLCMPTRGAVCFETIDSIERNMAVKYAKVIVARKPIVEARNLLAKTALECIAANPFPFTPRETFILWMDDDAMLLPGLIPTMLRCLHEPAMQNADALFGWHGIRQPFSRPSAWRRYGDPTSYVKPGVDCKPNELVDIEVAGFHLVLMRARLLERLGPDPFTPREGESEDFAFCRKTNEIGARLVVGTALPVPHIDPRDGTAYIPGQPAMIVVDGELRMLSAEHVGASGLKESEGRDYGLDGGNVFAKQHEQLEATNGELAQRQRISAGAA